MKSELLFTLSGIPVSRASARIYLCEASPRLLPTAIRTSMLSVSSAASSWQAYFTGKKPDTIIVSGARRTAYIT
jgi:hypothetical protein